MRLIRKAVYLVICLCMFGIDATAQKIDSNYSGYANGLLRDSIDHHLLQAATVSVYKVIDSSLVSFQLSNSYGEFHFNSLPVAIPLEIVVSYIGYKHYKQRFIIPARLKKIDLEIIYLGQTHIQLGEVTVSNYRPPVQMNGDTLEFNAEAFKLEKNAVVEDLLHKLPGITVWGDGKITVNGKTVSRVLVDGKPFFGGDGRIATQNLPKDAVDKIQVYSEKDQRRSPLDSIMNVNIKLKKNKNTGFFGKLGLGYGTDKKYSGDGMISLFSPLTQISLVGASNNNNIMVNDVGALMRNSSFKGVGVSIEYQPDFSMAGLNKSNSGGFNFQHDFIPDASNNKNNRIDASYFMNDYNSELNKNTQTTIRLNGDSNLVQKSSSVGHTSFLNQKLNTNYNLKTNKIEFYASQSLELNKSRNYSSNTNVSETSIPSLQSTNNALYNQNLDNQNFSLKAGLRNGPDKFKVDYAFSINSSQDRETNQILFISPFNSAQNDRYDRNYDNHLRTVYNELKSRVDFKRFLFGDRKVYDIGMEISNSLKINNDRTENNVKDRDTAANQYKVNTYLSNINRYQTVDEMPALSFSKMFIKVFTNRFRKSILLSADIQEQFFNQQNISEKQFQNFNHSYTSLLPAADITYTNDQFGDHLFTYKLNYNTSTGYPTVYQRAPLIDSANIYYQQRGNTTLKPFYKKEIAFTLSYISFQAKNLFDSYTINIQAGSVQNSIGDSTLYDNLGRATNYSVNLNGVRYLNANGDFYKAFKLQTNQLQISGNAKLSINNQPKYINGALNQLNNLFSDNSLSLLYTYKETIALKVTEAIALYKSRQRGDFNNELNNSIQKTILSASVNLPQNITFSSNITFNKNTSSYVPASSFNIWNASVMYRFLKGNQGEVKFSALDLLHQNTNIINYGINNSLTTGSVNVLKQYFMLTVAYYPRKFGKAKKKGD